MSANDLPPGFAVGAYLVERKLGQGGMGAVYAAVHRELPSMRAAVKVLAAAFAESTDIVERFKREAQAASVIGHPAIVGAFDWGQLPDGRPYLMMELLEGESLAERLARGPLAPDEARALFDQILRGLEAAHAAQIVHRDLKPENLFIVHPRHGDRSQRYAKVLDFGIAKLLETPGTAHTATGAVMGTPFYMAPEQARGAAVDHRADLYAVGVILYQCFAGRPPFMGASPTEILLQHVMDEPARPSTHASVPPAIEDLILACLAKSAEDRPADAAELRRRLLATATTAPAATTAAALTIPPRRRRADRRFWIAGALALVLAAGGGAVARRSLKPAAVAERVVPATAVVPAPPLPPPAAPAPAPARPDATAHADRRVRPSSRTAPTTPPPVAAPTRAQRRGLIETLEGGTAP